MKYTYKLIKYESSLTKNKLVDEVIDIDKFANLSGQQHTDINYNIWKERFIYKRNISSRLYQDRDTSIIKFIKDNNIQISDNITSLVELYNVVNKLSYQYANWCIQIKPNLYKKEKNDDVLLSSFFKGAMGEFIWHLYLKYNKKIRISENKKQTEYIFYNVCMRDIDDLDLGIDNIGEVEIDGKDKHNCIFQFKFYSPFESHEMTLKYIQSIHDEGVTKSFILSKDEKVNTFICWFGTDKDVSKWLKRADILNKCTKFIDINAIKINKSDGIIYEIIQKINDLINLD